MDLLKPITFAGRPCQILYQALNTLADIFNEARRNRARRLVGVRENLMDLVNCSAQLIADIDVDSR